MGAQTLESPVASPMASGGRRRRDARAGFTLVELMVALTAGLVVAAGAYMLSKTSLEVFHQEARLNAAQYNGLMGMNRLATDIKRAGYMTSANLANDPHRCGPNPGGAIAEMLTAIRVFEGADAATYGAALGAGDPAYGPLPTVVTNENLRAPDRLRLSGNYSTNETFEYTDVDTGASKIHLAVDRNAIQRVYRDFKLGGQGICQLFRPNGLVRLVDASGMETYVQLAGAGSHCTATERGDQTGWDGSIVLTYVGAVPQLPACDASAGPGYVNPVQVIEYVVKYLPPVNATLVAEGLGNGNDVFLDPDPSTPGLAANDIAVADGVTGEGTRLVLLRRELDGNANIIPGSAEVVADHVVDLNFRLRYATGAGANTLAFANFETTDLAGAPGNSGDWQRVRAVGVRLATRTKGPEREDNGVATPTADQPLRRFRLFPAAQNNRYAFARVRNLYTEIHLPNTQGAAW